MTASEPFVVVCPPRAWAPLNLRELWRYRHLLYVLAWRDTALRYKRTLLGAAWIVVQPLLTLAVFTILLGKLGRLPSDGLPYPVFIYSGLLPWQLFATAVSRATMSTVLNESLLTKVYVPRLLIPLSAALTGLVDSLVNLVLLLGMMLAYGIRPSWTTWNLLWLVPLTLVTALGVGFWFSAWNVRYRDFGNSLPFLVQLWLYATPVLYSMSLVPDRWRDTYALNPMVGVVQGFRWALFGHDPGWAIMIALGLSLTVFGGGLFYYRRMEQHFADVV